jgi:uncharacterized protein (DUF736 family)
MAGQDREGGAFFANTRKTAQNAPDYRGELRISKEVVENLVEQLKSGVQFPALEVSGWRKTSNSGTTYISMSGRKPYVKDGQAGQQRQAPQGGWSNGSGGGFTQGGQQTGWQPPAGNAIDDEIPF